MGERLVVNIFKNNTQCAVYYHWSGYTQTAFDEINNLLNIIENPERFYYVAPGKRIKPKDSTSLCYLKMRGLEESDLFDSASTPTATTSDWLLRVIHCLENNGGGLKNDSENLAFAKHTWPDEVFSTHVDRNEGLIAIVPKEIKNFNVWSEHFADINLDDQTVKIDTSIYSTEEVFECLGYDDPAEQDAYLKTVSKAPFDLSKPLTFSQIRDLVNGSIEADFQESFWKHPNEENTFFYIQI